MSQTFKYSPSPKDSRDYTLSSLSSTPLRATCDISSNDTTIKDQGAVGSCTAHATVAMMENNCKRVLKLVNNDVFREQFVYYMTRVNIANQLPTSDNGAFLRDVMKGLNKYGVCIEERCPYTAIVSTTPSQDAYTNALNYKIKSYYTIPIGSTPASRVNALKTLKNILSTGVPFVGGFACYENIYTSVNGIIPAPSGKMIGGHAVCFVGYDDVKQCFKFKNSWGIAWGDKGYGYLPYSQIYLMSDLWTITSADMSLFMVTKKSDVDKCISDGLVAISQGATPVCLPNRSDIQGFFNRVIAAKNEIR